MRQPESVILAVSLRLAGCGAGYPRQRVDDPARTPEASMALVYNSIADLLAGDLQETTTRATVLSELRDIPADWPLVGLGTTAQAHRNGEIVVFGSKGQPELLWCDPNEPH